MAGQTDGPQKIKRGCDTSEDSKPIDINKTGYDEAPAQYMANPEAGFWKTIKEKIKGVFS